MNAVATSVPMEFRLLRQFIVRCFPTTEQRPWLEALSALEAEGRHAPNLGILSLFFQSRREDKMNSLEREFVERIQLQALSRRQQRLQ